ncbi:MAG TPA: hypothetical protein VNH11_09590 [Pirellulales bacterium]|nr:hypothetical protein [Pirellulales bacterium]
MVDQLHETRKEWRLEPENIQKVVQIGLELAEQPPLIETKVNGIWPNPQSTSCPVFQLPALGGSWESCCDGLIHKHTQAVRPIVFDHNLSKGRDDVVLAHLNHKLVQMCLRLLRAEVWSREGRQKLNRITARIVPDRVLDAPAMIAHARLVVIGGDQHRLHEEIVTAGGLLREGRFARFRTLKEMDEALTAATDREPPKAVKKKLLDLWKQTADPLRQALESRMEDRTSGLTKTLTDRGNKEASDIEAILKELKKSIEDELQDPEYQQKELFSTPEREQFGRNVDALRRRALEIPSEIEKEKAAIKARFADPQSRLFPVAVTYLVPEKFV